MRFVFLIPFFLFCEIVIFAQSPSHEKVELSQKDLEKFKKAKVQHRQKKYDEALKVYCKLLKKYTDNSEIELWVGLLHKDKGDNVKALPYLIKASEGAQSDNSLLFSTIAEIYRESKDYLASNKYYKLFLSKVDSTSQYFINGKKIHDQLELTIQMINNAHTISPIPLNYNINTLWSEYLPQFTADGATLYFTRRINAQEDLFFASCIADSCETSQSFDPINTPMNEGAHSVSADGTRIIFTRCDSRSGMGSCDLYIVEKIKDVWSKPKNMGSRINTMNWESQPSLSGDGNLLYFSSTRDGGRGAADIWYSVRSTDGTWSFPVNAGPEINTTGNDGSPFIHADLKTLYFRSDGHMGMGQNDLFIARQDSSKQWRNVQNMGYPISSEGDDGALVVSLDGKTAFFATDFDGESIRNNLDIYRFDLPESLRPTPCTFIKLRIIDKNTKFPIKAILEVTDLNNGEILSRKESDLNGEILTPVPLRENTMINISAEEYLFFSENIFFDSISHGMAPFLKTIGLSRLTHSEEERFILKNIFFESGTSLLQDVSFAEIQKVADILLKYPKYTLKIIGHTDDIGSEQDNLNLSLARANAVKYALIQMNINSNRLSAEGSGESAPIADNTTEAGRRENRRTEFVLIKD